MLIDTHASTPRRRGHRAAEPPRGRAPHGPAGPPSKGHPSRGAIDTLTASPRLGGSATSTGTWWRRPDDTGIDDYLSGRRVSVVADVSGSDRSGRAAPQAVQLVFADQGEPAWQWLAITGISEHFGINPQALRVWVRRAEREGHGPS